MDCHDHPSRGYHELYTVQRAILDYMSWRHPSSSIDDPKSLVDSYNMEDVRWLILKGADGNAMEASFLLYPLAVVDAAIPDPTPEDLTVGNPSAKVIAKAEASHKRKASTSSATSSNVARSTRSALAQSSGSTTRPNLFADNSGEESDDDDDACVEIMLITYIRFVADPASRNQGRGFAAPTAEGPSTRDISGDAIHRDFFPFSPGPYYATYPEGGVASNCEFSHEEWDAPHQPTLIILTKEVFKDPSVCKTVVD
ncbi:hypothetical protein Tco_0313146 [Tanacetum coccineum]